MNAGWLFKGLIIMSLAALPCLFDWMMHASASALLSLVG